MTIPHSLLSDRVGSGPVQIQRFEFGAKYIEHNPERVRALIAAGCVEGLATRTGKILFLREIMDESEMSIKLADIVRKQNPESSGSIISGASQTAYRQHLETGHTCWALHNLQDGWNRQSLSAFVGNAQYATAL